MSRRGWLVLGGCVLAGVVAVAVVIGGGRRGGSPDSSPIPSSAAAPGSSLLTAVTRSPVPSATPTPTTRPAPIATLAPTAPPRATGDPRLAYAEFLLRVNDDRTTVEGLNHALSTAAQAQDHDAGRIAAVKILDFVDGERDWLREHPPASCYAKARASANAMLDAYGGAADKFVTWAASTGGLSGLAALGDAIDAAQAATDALTDFGKVLDATKCAA